MIYKFEDLRIYVKRPYNDMGDYAYFTVSSGNIYYDTELRGIVIIDDIAFKKMKGVE